MLAPHSFDYAIIRVVPRVERGEFINAGAVLFCRTLRFLQARVMLDPRRLAALAADLDPGQIESHLASFPIVAAGGPAAGQFQHLTLAERFHWLVAPRSSSIQLSPVHCGLCHDPAATLDHLMQTMVH
jgi:hypothetical protein